MYRIYDTKEERWVKEDIFLSPNDDVYLVSKKIFTPKVSLIERSRYIVQRCLLDVADINNKLIYDGDIVEFKNEDKTIIGLIAYIPQNLCYVALDYSDNKYYLLSSSILVNAKVIGNICENEDLLLKKNEAEGKVE